MFMLNLCNVIYINICISIFLNIYISLYYSAIVRFCSIIVINDH